MRNAKYSAGEINIQTRHQNAMSRTARASRRNTNSTLWKFTEGSNFLQQFPSQPGQGRLRESPGLWAAVGVGLRARESVRHSSGVAQWFPTAGLLSVTAPADEPCLLWESKWLSTLTASTTNACHNKQLLIRETFLWCFGSNWIICTDVFEF